MRLEALPPDPSPGGDGFAGVLVTDWAEIQQLNVFHKTAATPKEAVRIAIGETSIDLSMVPSDTTFFDYLVELVQ